MADALLTTDLDLANHTGKGVWSKNIKSGVLAQLAVADPEIKVGATDIFTFLTAAKAELVGEGANKSSMDGKPTKATVKTYKVQITYRMSDEVMYEDEDYQLGLVDALVGRISTGLSRALDLLAIHGVNPATGVVSASISQYLDKSGNGVFKNTATADADADVMEMAADLQGAGYDATGIAFDPAFAGKLARSNDLNGVRKYPELGLGFNVSNFQGLTAASSDTVSGKNELAPADALVQAIMGDFNAFKWGVARNVPLETIQFGDPDGNGDLKRTNEIAIRAEAILGFAFLDESAFAIVKKTSNSQQLVAITRLQPAAMPVVFVYGIIWNMKQRNYFNKETQQIKAFNRVAALKLGPDWEFIPKIENYIDDDGKHHVKMLFDDFTVDMVETDESIAAGLADATNIISDVEVIDNGNTNTK